MQDKFNLQVPLTKEVELKLRYKAELFGMNLTQYARFLLMQDVMSVVVPDNYEPKKSNRKPPNSKKKVSTSKETKEKPVPVVPAKEESEPNTGKKEIPTNQNNQENKIIITGKPSKFNKFGGR